jgi:hypothetical protein
VLAEIVELRLRLHAFIVEDGRIVVIIGQAAAIEELLMTDEAIGQAKETVELLVTEIKVANAQAIAEDEIGAVFVIEHSSLELVEVETKEQEDALELIAQLLLVPTVDVLLNNGQALILVELVATVELKMVLLATLSAS